MGGGEKGEDGSETAECPGVPSLEEAAVGGPIGTAGSYGRNVSPEWGREKQWILVRSETPLAFVGDWIGVSRLLLLACELAGFPGPLRRRPRKSPPRRTLGVG